MIEKQNIQNIYRLSPMQAGMLFHAMHEPESAMYFEQFRFLIEGDFDVDLFKETWAQLQARHDVFRTVFVVKNVPEPLQLVLKKCPTPFAYSDIRSQTEDEKTAFINDFIESDRKQGFNLNRDVPFRIHVIQVADGVYETFWSFHHIVMDGWCLHVLQEEFAEIYVALKQGRSHQLPPPVPYSRYIKWLDARDQKVSRKHWQNYLDGYAQRIQLPYRQGDVRHSTFLPEHHTVQLSQDLTHKLNALAKQCGATLNVAFQCAWGLMVARSTGNLDVGFVATVSGRPTEIVGVERMVGLLINAVPVRVKPDLTASFETLVKKVQADALENEAHHACPLADIQADLGLQGGVSDHILVFENYPRNASEDEADELLGFKTTYQGAFEQTNYDLTVQIFPESELLLDLAYNPEVFDESAMQSIEADLIQTIETVLAQTDQPLQDAVAELGVEALPVHVAATFTAEPMQDAMLYWGRVFGVPVAVEFAPYNQIFQVLLDDQSALVKQEGFHVLLVRFEDWLRDMNLMGSDAISHLEKNYAQLTDILNRRRFAGPVAVGIFSVGTHLVDEEVATFIEELNVKWEAFVEAHPDLHVIDYDAAAKSFGFEDVFDLQKDRAGHIPFTDAFCAAMGTVAFRKILAWKRPHFKVISIDCDNTLWRGVCGEDGALGVKIEEGHKVLQQFLIDRYNEGFLLVINSKNNPDDAWAVFDEHPDMILGREHIVTHRINWSPKSQNLYEMADELNLGVDSFVFLDDSHAECAEVMVDCPDVLTLRIPEDSSLLPKFLDHVWAFDRFVVTDEDRQRNAMYVAEQQRQAHHEDVVSMTTFLEGLDLRVAMYPVTETQLGRVAQLTQRTNQFNLSTIRRTESALRNLMTDDSVMCWAVEVADRFGSYGLIGEVIVQEKDGALLLDTFLMSCRVLGRGVEHAILMGVRRYCETLGISHLEATCVHTARNTPFREFIDALGWAPERVDGDRAAYRIAVTDLPDDVPHVTFLDTPLPAEKQTETQGVASAGLPVPTVSDAELDVHFSFTFTNLSALVHRDYYRPLETCSPAGLLRLPSMQVTGRVERQPYVAPENETQTRLVALWQELLLCDEDIGIHDDFFALGGHSLKATQLVSRLYSQFEVDVSLSEIFDHPTVEMLSQVIEQKGDRTFEAIEPISQQEMYELSHAQRRLWVLEKMDPDACAYNMVGAYALDGVVHTDALKQAFEQLVMRHESLRTTFVTEQGDPKQVVHKNMNLSFDVHELETEDQVKDFVAQEGQTPFDLENGPLFRVLLLKISETRSVLIIGMHHIVGDGWSFGVLARDVLATYAKSDPLPPLRIHYKDFAAWQNGLLEGEESKTHRDYWHEKLSGELPVLNLPTDFPRPKVMTYDGTSRRFVLGGDLLAGLQDVSQKNQATLFMTLMALVKVLLFRYSSQDDVIVGTPVAGRVHPDLEDQIGFYVNTLALRDSIQSDNRFADVLARVKTTALDAFEHQIYPFDRLVDELQISRSTDRGALFDVMVVLQNQDMDEQKLDDLHVSSMTFDRVSSRFDLTFEFAAQTDGLHAEIAYRTDLFRAETIDRFWLHFAYLAKQVVSDATQEIGRLSLLTEVEEDHLKTFNETDREFPTDVTLMDLFEAQVLESAEQLALIHGSTVWSYEDLNRRANEIGHVLAQDYQVRAGDIVGVMCDRCVDQMAALLGILKIGAVYLPIDPEYPEDRIDYMLSNSGCQVVLTEETTTRDDVTCVMLSSLEGENAENPERNIQPDDLAYVIYTSGSTGVPKGVMVPHRGFVNMTLDQIRGFGVQADDRVLQFASASFDASLSEIFMALLKGAALVLIDRAVILDPAQFKAYMQTHEVSVVTLPPAYLSALNRDPLPSVRVMITAGEAAHVEDAQYYAQDKAYFNAYGPTEYSVCISYHRVDAQKNYAGAIPIGKPISNTKAWVMDAMLQPVPVGVSGEICVSGVGLAKGYLGDEAQTQAKFVAHPVEKNALLYKTGDLGYWTKDGELVFLGRIDTQVKVRGHRIELDELTRHMISCEDVVDAVVVDQVGVTGETILVGYFVGDTSAELVRAHLAQKVPDYMVPTFILPLDVLPLTPNGKVDRKKLPDPSGLAAETKVGPRSETERDLVHIFSEVLGVDEIGVFDSFFNLGGHSLQVVRLVSQVKDRLDVDLPAAMVFASPTVADLAQQIQMGHRSAEVLLGEGKQGTVFCLPGILGYGMMYADFANALSDYTVWGFDFVDEKDIVHFYADRICALDQGLNPVILLGYSTGGSLAFAVGQELIRRGRSIGSLVLLDTYRRESKQSLDVFQEAQHIYDQYRTFIDAHEFGHETAIRDRIEAYLNVMQDLLDVGQISAPIYLVKATDRNVSPESWVQATSGDFEALVGSGGHFQMLSTPFAQENAQVLQTLLGKMDH